MVTVDEIVAAVQRLRPDRFLRLRRRLDRIERRLWQAESFQAGQELEASGVSDQDADQIVMRHRREGPR